MHLLRVSDWLEIGRGAGAGETIWPQRAPEEGPGGSPSVPHGVRVLRQFTLSTPTELWAPGPHPDAGERGPLPHVFRDRSK